MSEKMNPSRRNFIIRALASSAVLGLTSPIARAGILNISDQRRFRSFLPQLGRRKPNGFFVSLTAGSTGGLDCTLGLDPKLQSEASDPKDLFIEYRDEDIITTQGLRLGPAAHALKSHAEDIAIINGIVMRRDAGHQTLMEYIQSGDQTGKTGALSAEHATEFELTAFGLIYSGFSSIPAPGKELMLSSASDLIQKISDPAPALLNGDDDASLLKDSWDALRMMLDRIPEVKKQHTSLPSCSVENTGDAIKVVAASFLAGASTEAQIALQPVTNFDTHSNHPTEHLKRQTDFWNEVAIVFDYFKKIPFGSGSLFDATTFMVSTEFSRTPALNAANGKDHNPFTNSCLIAGRGVNGGQVIGASHVISRKNRADQAPLHIGQAFDYEFGRAVSSAGNGVSLIYPENVIASVRKILDMPTNGAKLLPKLVKG